MLFVKHAESAKRALSLQKDTVFKLLLVMTIMLGWISGVGAGSIMGLENMYNRWHLEQKNQITVYIEADSNPNTISTLLEDLDKTPGITHAKQLTSDEVSEFLTPYFKNVEGMPLPIVLDITTSSKLDRKLLEHKVAKLLPKAEIEDNRQILQSISQAVRFVQIGVIVLALILLTVVALIVSLTVRAGLRGKATTLATLQYIGATDKFVTTLITRQVMWRSMLGWVIASSAACASLFAIASSWGTVAPFMNINVWIAAAGTPLLLPITSIIATMLTAVNVVKNHEKADD